jgi:hypothetical protein
VPGLLLFCFERPKVGIYLHPALAFEIGWHSPRVPAGTTSAIFKLAGGKNGSGLVEYLKLWWRLPLFVFHNASNVSFSGLPLDYEVNEDLTTLGLHIGSNQKRRPRFCTAAFETGQKLAFDRVENPFVSIFIGGRPARGRDEVEQLRIISPIITARTVIIEAAKKTFVF